MQFPTQWEQDDIHEKMDCGWTLNEIQVATARKFPEFVLGLVAARYRAFLCGECPEPYLDGTRLTEPLGELPQKRLAPNRIIGETNGEQVF